MLFCGFNGDASNDVIAIYCIYVILKNSPNLFVGKLHSLFEDTFVILILNGNHFGFKIEIIHQVQTLLVVLNQIRAAKKMPFFITVLIVCQL